MRKRMIRTLFAGLMLVGGLLALPAQPVEAAECDITVTIQADIPLSLDVSDPAHPVFKGSVEVLPKSEFGDTRQVVNVIMPDFLIMQTPDGMRMAPEGTKAEMIGSINAQKGYHNYCLEHTYPEYLEKDEFYVEIPVTPELLACGLGEYSVTIPITFVASVEYGLYSYHYDFTSWPDLITNGDITVSSAKLTNAKTTGMVLDMDPSITSIDSYAFKNSHCHEVIIPSSVTSGANAFNGSSTEVVTFDQGTVMVPASICCGAKNLQIASLATTVKNIGSHAFEDCTSLYFLSDNMLQELGANCFKNCTSLEEFTVYNGTTCSVSMQSSSPFYGSGLKRVNVSAGTTKISSYMFVNCPNLSEVDLPPTLSILGSYAFASVPKLKEITIRSNISRDNTSTTAGCFSNTGLTKITFEDGVSSVPRYMFSGGCANVTELNLPDSITYIDSSAFSGCSSLAELDLPDGLTTLGGDAFENAISLKEIHIEHDIALPRSCIVSPFAGSGLEKIVIDEGVTTVVPNLFNRGCDHVTEISLPSTIQVLGGQAFGNAASLKTVTIPVNVSLPYGGVVSPFDNSSLETIIFSEGVTAIPSSLFRSGCSKVTSIVFPSTLQSIGYDAFDGCTSLAELNLPESVTSIGLGAFEDSVNLTSLNVNSSWSKPSGADLSPFAGSGLTSVTVKTGLSQIKAMHLANNSNVAIVMEIPTSVTSIDGSTFLEGEIYSVIYDGTSAQYELITKGEGFNPTCVICTDTILTNSLMEEVNEDDLDDLFSGLLDEPEEEDAEPIAEEDPEEDSEEELTVPEEPVIIPVDVADQDDTDEIDSSAGEENYAEPIPSESPDNAGIMQTEGMEGVDTTIGIPDFDTVIPETPLDTGNPVPEEVSGDVG